MGNFTSTFGGSVPKDPDDTLNYILKGIFSNIDLMDMYAMMDQKKCAEYVIFGEKALDTIFVKMNLMPSRDARGYIYFRRMTTLRNELARSEDHKKMCKEIAFFFATLLRCFGALWMSIKQANRPLTQISGVTESPTGEIFQQKSVGQKFMNRIFAKQAGGAIDTLQGLTMNEAVSLQDSKLLGRLVKQYFNSTTNRQYFTLNTENIAKDSHSDISIMMDTSTVYYKKYGEGRGSPAPGFSPGPPRLDIPVQRQGFASPLGLRRPIPQKGGQPNTQTLFSILEGRGSGMEALEVEIAYETPVLLKYSFGKGANSQYSYSFQLNIEQKGEETNNFKITLADFKWEQSPPKTRKDISGFQKTVDVQLGSQSGIYVFINNNRMSIDRYLLGQCKKIEEDVYDNPNVTTSDYLVRWKYLDESGSLGTRTKLQNISPQDLYFDYDTRKNQAVRITYLKTGVKIPGRREPDRLYIDCFVTITRQDNSATENGNKYTVIITDISAKSESRANLEGVFTPLPSQVESRTFYSRFDTEPPVNSSGLDIPKFLRRVADRQINQNATETDAAYRRVRMGDYLRIPVADSTNPYDLGKLQDMMSPTKSPFPACTALAYELVNGLKTNPVTAVCNPKFATRTDGSLPRGNGAELRTSSGILALSSLFIESMEADAKTITELGEWKEFTENMKAVSAADLKARCKTRDSSMELDKSIAGEVNGIVQQLMDRQRQHNEAAFTIVWELFDRDAAMQKRGFRINESLYSGGMQRLLEVKARCIDLLTRYYVDCDSMYLNGVRMIIDRQGKPVVAVQQARESGPTAPERENDENYDEPEDLEERP